MTRVAVIAHRGKSVGGGLPELRRVLERARRDGRVLARGGEEPLRARARSGRRSRARPSSSSCGAATAWCSAASTSSRARSATVAIIPAGTANLLATNLGIPKDIEQAVDIGLSGNARRIDVGRLNGECFAVMAGAGFDARMIGDADGGLKDRFGRLAYVWTGAKHLREKPFRAKIKVDGARWYDGDASCILLGNVGKLFGGVEAFEDAQPDDGVLELGVVSADGVREWAGTVARAVVGTAASSPHAFTTKAHSVRIKLDRKVPYEIDGGDRKKTRKLRIDVEPDAVQICVPVPFRLSTARASGRARRGPRAASRRASRARSGGS